MKKRKKAVYLAGGIEQLEGSKAKSWRKKAKELLGPEIHVLDPMRHPRSKHMVDQELNDIHASDAVLMEINILDRMYIGTIMECVYAHRAGVPVVIWSSLPRVKDDPWIAKHKPAAIADTLEEAVEEVKELVAPRAKKRAGIGKSIIVSGYASSGKSTLAKRLAEHFSVTYVDGGDALKELAAQEGYTVTGKEWWDTSEGMRFLGQRQTDPNFDHRVDDILKRYAERVVVMTSWTLPWIHQGPVNVWLDTSTIERARRLAGRDSIKLSLARRIIRERDRENTAHYKALYGIRFGKDMKPFHCVINGNMSRDEIFATCIEKLSDII